MSLTLLQCCYSRVNKAHCSWHMRIVFHWAIGNGLVLWEGGIIKDSLWLNFVVTSKEFDLPLFAKYCYEHWSWRDLWTSFDWFPFEAYALKRKITHQRASENKMWLIWIHDKWYIKRTVDLYLGLRSEILSFNVGWEQKNIFHGIAPISILCSTILLWQVSTTRPYHGFDCHFDSLATM